MSIIGIDASRANGKTRTGTEWYAFHLIQELKTIIPASHRVMLYSAEPLRDGLENLPSNWESRVLGWPPKRLWTQVRLSWEMFRRPPDLLFVPVHAMPVIQPKRSVTTIHDVAFVTQRGAYSPFEQWYQRFAVRLAVKKADTVLTVSEFSKGEIVRHFRAKPEKITVTHLGYDAAEFSPVPKDDALRDRLAKYGVSRPYFLFVGRLEAKKNLVGLLRAFKLFKDKRGVGDPVRLVLVGKRGIGGNESFRVIAESPVRASVVEVGYAAREDLAALYSGAEALVFPSWYEGFGLPVLEAFACGTPVIASNTASIPEVGGDAVLYVDPSSPGAIAAAMERIVNEPSLRQDLAAKGFARLKLFSWRKTAQETWQALDKALPR